MTIRSFLTHSLFAAGLLAFVAGPAAGTEPRAEDYRAEADRIIDAALASDEAWAKIVELCDGVGHRLSGSPQLAHAVDWAQERMSLDGLENVRRQRVMVPRWVRGTERAAMTAPRRAELSMLGLGRSVATPPGGLTAEVVVARDFAELEAMPESRVAGKIVLWDVPFTTYGQTVRYRWEGAIRASEKGAVASLVRSVGPRSLRSPHTGVMRAWEEGERAIPAAALALEDAMMISRFAERGIRVSVQLEMEARTEPDAESHNVMGEIVGRERPDEIVVIGGHLDSWDVGQGAHDDGGGCVISMEAVRLLHELGLRPRRTIRVVLWTNEENGTRGAEEYYESVRDDIGNHVAAIESDGGVETPWGFGLSVWADEEGTPDERRQDRALKTLAELGRLLSPIDADSVRAGGGGADISPLMRHGVPGLALRTPMEKYWDIHHTHADTVDKIDPSSLKHNVAAMAVMAWVLAEMPGRLAD